MSLRRVRPQIDDYSDADGDADELMADGESGESDGSVDDAESAAGTDDGGSEPEETATEALSKVSFGTLSKAATSLRHSQSRAAAADPTSARALAVKAQLSALKSASSPPAAPQAEKKKDKKARKTREELKRTSKHAPQEVSSKRAVTRRREVVAPLVPAGLQPRDPRFDTAVRGVFDERVFRQNYGFLEGYREDEVRALRRDMERERDGARRGEMERVVKSMESKKHQQAQKLRSEELMREHKKKEREMIKQGKKPFYLKKTEQKKLLLVDRFRALSDKQLDRVVEKKRKRKAQKEHKNIPYARREA
ncbi:rRNA biogenesis protein RRP36 [Morchella snyderi]|nr:rRNA biogenesis protein RRP36 [Morchella snyderi]